MDRTFCFTTVLVHRLTVLPPPRQQVYISGNVCNIPHHKNVGLLLALMYMTLDVVHLTNLY